MKLLCPPIQGPPALVTEDFVELFAAAADRHATSPAVACEGCCLTFGEFRTNVQALAGELLARNRASASASTSCAASPVRDREELAAAASPPLPPPPLLVAVCLDRTPALAVALMAALWTGGAYLPLEPSHPEARREALVQDSGASLLVLEEGASWRGSVLSEQRCIRIKAPQGIVVDSSALPLIKPTSPPDWRSSLAYVIYTSGSTGAPKGVSVKRQGVVNILQAFEGMLRGGTFVADGSAETLVSVTTCCFDIFALELFWPLCFGFKVYLASSGAARSGTLLKDILIRESARYFQATPTTFRSLSAADFQGGPGFSAICGGETFPPNLATSLISICGGGLWNAYGPTEATIWSTTFDLKAAPPSSADTKISIGKPLPGNVALILEVSDTAEEPPQAASALVGELALGGIGVAHGYHRLPQLTAAKFGVIEELKDLDDCGDARAYLTGDLVRLDPGCFQTGGSSSSSSSPVQLEFLGRLDGQVKLRGFRLELGEVEATLERCQGIQAAAAVIAKDESGETLVAYLVLAAQQDGEVPPNFDVGQLRAHLSSTLPAYMIPSKLFVVDSLPTLTSGKVDRRLLSQNGAVGATCLDTTEQDGARLGQELRSHLLKGTCHAADTLATLAQLLSTVTGFGVGTTEEEDQLDSLRLEALGIDSQAAVPLAELLTTTVLQSSATVELEDLYVYDTLGALIEYLRQKLGLQSASDHGFRMGTEPEAEVQPSSATHQLAPANKKGGRPKRAAQQRLRQENSKSGPALQLSPGLDACRSGDVELLKGLIESNAFQHERDLDRFGGCGLHWAASGGHFAVCQLLAQNKANVAFADKKSGRCALHWACRQGHLEIARWLVEEHGQSIEVTAKDGTTALQFAAWGGHVHICDWLAAAGAQLDRRNGWHCLPHHFAALAGMLESCRWLHEHGVDLGDTNNQGHNALHKAAYGGHLAVCEWLQDEVKLDPLATIPDVRGQTSVDLAAKAGFNDLAAWLTERRQSPQGS